MTVCLDHLQSFNLFFCVLDNHQGSGHGGTGAFLELKARQHLGSTAPISMGISTAIFLKKTKFHCFLSSKDIFVCPFFHAKALQYSRIFLSD